MTDQQSRDLPFNISPQDWDAMSPEGKTSLMQMEMNEAQARHAAHRAEVAMADQQAWSAALGTIRLLMALNAGAIIAILAFLGAMIEARADLWLCPLVASLILFLMGATLSVICSAVAFFAGSTLVESLQDDVLTTRHPYVLGTKKSIALIGSYNGLRYLGVGICAASLLCALGGSVAFLIFSVSALQG